ncbi:hypothetical protein AMTR_s00001p00255730 [Amborella trichopoda]|uniref:Uncharacterized protein n=1 Tax=Amborella trichopoda TaxID=13333 RepID=W1NLR7_AMBTC|nr:hypothetical protein AMTR_s00001p00255730 [Amborella trichopoda]
MYGYAGSLSALLGAVIILRRRNLCASPEFAIVRITETFIRVFVELLIETTRATRLAMELETYLADGLGKSKSWAGRERKREDR